MAAYRRLVSVLCCLSLLGSFASASTISLPSDSRKVSLTLYYESLCPYSANFIVNYLPKLFNEDLISIVDLRLVPWGNAKLKGNGTFDCQHGPTECLLNTVEACAIDAWPKLNDHFPFIYCVENLELERKPLEWESCFKKLGLESKPVNDCYNSGLGQKLDLQYAAETSALEPPHTYVPWVVVDGQPLYENDHFPFIYCVENLELERKPLEWESCFKKLGLESKPVNDCYNSGLGQKLDLQYAAETSALEPPHTYVPWVVVDGQPLYEDYENYISYVCKAYKGANMPKACSGLTFNQIYNRKTIHPVCYKEIPPSTLSSRTISTVMSWIQKIVTSM